MDGEVGRFAIASYVVAGQGNTIKTWSYFPTLKGREVYTSKGFKEVALLEGTVRSSYRHVARQMNRIRHQEAAGTPIMSLRDRSEREGEQVLAHWQATATATLAGQGLSPAALATPTDLPPVEVAAPASAWLETDDVARAIAVCVPPEYQATAAANPLPYAHPNHVVDLCADAVLAKQQKTKRPRERTPAAPRPDPKAPRTRVSNKVATIHQQHRSYALVAATYQLLLACVVAFLFQNKLTNHVLCFFVDGEKALHQAILTALRWHPCIFIILDWHHLKKKCGEMLSLAIKGKGIRNHHLQQVSQRLWYGDVTSAIAYLQTIPDEQRKFTQSIETLIEYLTRNREHIPCYAMRKQLGLRNSSNAVEKCNDLLVSQRQKHQGMSWSKEGSLALAALGTIDFNGHRTRWLDDGQIPFAFPVAS